MNLINSVLLQVYLLNDNSIKVCCLYSTPINLKKNTLFINLVYIKFRYS